MDAVTGKKQADLVKNVTVSLHRIIQSPGAGEGGGGSCSKVIGDVRLYDCLL